MVVNEKYSNKGFPCHGLSFKGVPVEEFNNLEIRRSCFYQEWIDDGDTMKDIFPDDMIGVTFVKCNLDNVFVPSGNIIIGGTNKRIRVQNDLEDWVVDKNDKPVEPLHVKRFDRAGISVDPKDIPKDFNRVEELELSEYNKIKNDPEFLKWWKVVPVVTNQEDRMIANIVDKRLVKETKTFVTIEGSGKLFISGNGRMHNSKSVCMKKIHQDRLDLITVI